MVITETCNDNHLKVQQQINRKMSKTVRMVIIPQNWLSFGLFAQVRACYKSIAFEPNGYHFSKRDTKMVIKTTQMVINTPQNGYHWPRSVAGCQYTPLITSLITSWSKWLSQNIDGYQSSNHYTPQTTFKT